MYNDFFGLRKEPFSLTPDPSFLFLTEQHRAALCGLTSGILQRSGFVLLTGDVGTGKTTLLSRVLRFMPASRLQFSRIVNPTLTPSEFLELVLLDFGVKDIPSSKAQRLWKLQNLVLENEREGKVSALIIDEAHRLSPEVLEEIRLLGNFEQAEHKHIQILLVGQNEMEATLNREEMRPLKQRIAVRLSLRPLAYTEVGQYMAYRWSRSGGAELPFSPEAIAAVARASEGVPRVVNSLCHHVLLAAFAEKSSHIRESQVRAAAGSLDFGEKPRVQKTAKLELPTPVIASETPTSRWSRWFSRFRAAPNPARGLRL